MSTRTSAFLKHPNCIVEHKERWRGYFGKTKFFFLVQKIILRAASGLMVRRYMQELQEGFGSFQWHAVEKNCCRNFHIDPRRSSLKK